jgi:hypothetical protein
MLEVVSVDIIPSLRYVVNYYLCKLQINYVIIVQEHMYKCLYLIPMPCKFCMKQQSDVHL